MLKQPPSRNQRSKGFKVKHALQIFLLLAICIWLLYQLRHSLHKKAYQESSAKMSGKMHNGREIIRLGRRGLHPWAEETSLDIGRHGEKEESEEEVDESKGEEIEEEGRGAGDDEVDGHDQERAEEESEGVEDLIDEEDTEREEETEEQESEDKGNDLESLRLLEDQAKNEDTRNSQEARDEHYKDDDASSAVKQNTQTITNEIEIGSLRKVKEKEADNAENIVEKEIKTNGVQDFEVDINDSSKNAAFENSVFREERGNQFGSGNSDTYANSSVKTIEQPKLSKDDSTVMLVEVADSFNETEMLPELYRDASHTSGQRHSYLEVSIMKQNENAKSEDMQSSSNMTFSSTDNLDASKREMTVTTGSENESFVSEVTAKFEKGSDPTTSNGNSLAFGTVERAVESSMTLTTHKNVDAVQEESHSLGSS